MTKLVLQPEVAIDSADLVTDCPICSATYTPTSWHERGWITWSLGSAPTEPYAFSERRAWGMVVADYRCSQNHEWGWLVGRNGQLFCALYPPSPRPWWYGI
jgi:hypothetical protein